MKTLKRALALLLALAMVFALAACGSRSRDDEDDEDERPSSRRRNRDAVSEERTGADSAGGFALPGMEWPESGKPTEAPAEKPAEVPAEKPAEVPAEKPVEVPAEKPAEVPAAEPLRVALILWGGLDSDLYGRDIEAELDRLVQKGDIVYDAYDAPLYDDAQETLWEAIDDGADVVVVTDYSYGEAVGAVAPACPEVCFLCLDMTEFDLYWGDGTPIPPNVSFLCFREEQAGFLAGYAAVRMGYKNLGFLGGMAVPAVVRYGIGFVQGANIAADEYGISGVSVKYAYANQFFGDADITDAMRDWYADGTEVVFACGGGLFTSVGEAAAAYAGRVIGVDYDQKSIIDSLYGEGITLSSAVKNAGLAVAMALTQMKEGSFEGTGGSVTYRLGIDDAGANCFVGLAASTEFNAGFTESDCETLLFNVSIDLYFIGDDVTVAPEDWAWAVQVLNLGNLK